MKHRIVRIAPLTLALMLAAAVAAPAQLAEVTIRVDGLSCPFCAYGLEKRLQRLAGVEELVIDVAEGIASLSPAREGGLDFRALARAVREAGFTPRGIRVRGRGRIERTGGESRLLDPAGGVLFVLEPNAVLARLQGREGATVAFKGLVSFPNLKDGAAPQQAHLALTEISTSEED